MRSTKTMLMGIALMLVAIYNSHEVGFATSTSGFVLLTIGFILVFIGFCINDKPER